MPAGLSAHYDVASVRGLYPALADGWTYLNAHAHPQIPERVASAVARSFRRSPIVAAHEGGAGAHAAGAPVAGQLEGEGFVRAARMAVADLVGTQADRVVLGPSLPVLYRGLAQALAPVIRRSSSVVLSRLDPPRLSAALAGVDAEVRWAQPDLGTGELPAFQFADLVEGSTRLVAFSAAHELLGTVCATREISELVHSRSRAWVLVDVSSLAPYRPVDFAALGADILGLELSQLGGPQLAALVFRDPAMFRRLEALVPPAAEGAAPGHPGAKLETPISSGLAGAAGALVDHMAALAGGESGSRRVRVARSLGALDFYLDDLRRDMYSYLGTLPAVHILGASGEVASGASHDRIPRLSFAVRGVAAATVHQRLFDNRLVTTVSPRTPLFTDMGAEEIGGAVTVSLGPFNTRYDIEHLTRVVASLA